MKLHYFRSSYACCRIYRFNHSYDSIITFHLFGTFIYIFLCSQPSSTINMLKSLFVYLDSIDVFIADIQRMYTYGNLHLIKKQNQIDTQNHHENIDPITRLWHVQCRFELSFKKITCLNQWIRVVLKIPNGFHWRTKLKFFFLNSSALIFCFVHKLEGSFLKYLFESGKSISKLYLLLSMAVFFLVLRNKM